MSCRPSNKLVIMDGIAVAVRSSESSVRLAEYTRLPFAMQQFARSQEETGAQLWPKTASQHNNRQESSNPAQTHCVSHDSRVPRQLIVPPFLTRPVRCGSRYSIPLPIPESRTQLLPHHLVQEIELRLALHHHHALLS